MTFHERHDASSDVMESELHYDCVDDPAVADEAPLDARVNPALQYTNLEEEHVNERVLEVEYLSALGINVVDLTLPLDVQRISLLPQYQRVAQHRWNQLYNGNDHLKLSKAIARELKMNYDEYKKQNSSS